MKNKTGAFTSFHLATKRQEFILLSSLLSVSFLSILLVPVSLRMVMLAMTCLLSIIFTFYSFGSSNTKFTLLVLCILPVFFTLTSGLFYFVFPVRWITRLPMTMVYTISLYAVFLISNIYTIATDKAIQLIRVARAIGFLLTLLIIQMGMMVVYSLHLNVMYTMILCFPVFTALCLHSCWTITLQKKWDKKIIVYSMVLGLILSQASVVVSFYPLKPIIGALFITSCAFTLLGITHLDLSSRLFQNTVYDYIRIFILVFLLIFLTVSYR